MYQTLIFWQGFWEFKRHEESKRMLKNLFASRLAEFDTTLRLKLLRIAGQWYIPIKLWFGRNPELLAFLSLPLAGGLREGRRFDAYQRLIFSTSFHTSSDNRDRNMQKWNSNNRGYVRKKPLRHGSDWGDPRRSWLREAHCSLQRRVLVNCLLNPLTADKI